MAPIFYHAAPRPGQSLGKTSGRRIGSHEEVDREPPLLLLLPNAGPPRNRSPKPNGQDRGRVSTAAETFVVHCHRGLATNGAIHEALVRALAALGDPPARPAGI